MLSKEQQIKNLEAKYKKLTPLDEVHQSYHRKISHIDRNWNKTRLLSLVSVELRQRFFRAEDKFKDELYRVNDKEKIRLYEMMIRAYDALEKEAIAYRFNKLAPKVWVVKHPTEDIKCIVCENEDDLPYVVANYGNEKNSMFFCIKELLLTMDKEAYDIKLKFVDFDATIKDFKKL